MRISTTLSAIFILSFFATNSIAQNVGIGVATPLQKLHVGGNVRVDGMATPGTGVITTNASGDLLRTNFSGNANDVLKGNGTFGTVPGGLPSGAIVASLSSNDANLIAAGFSFYGELSNTPKIYSSYPATTSNQFTLAPTYENGNPAKTQPPTGRTSSTGLWTGSEAIIWGGFDQVGTIYNFFNDGSKYNPLTDTWTTMSTVNAPSSRGACASVFSGTEMVIWGGLDSAYIDFDGITATYFFSTTGGRYNPATNIWNPTPMSTVGAPALRWQPSAVWNGTYMVVWGGSNELGTLQDGGRYNPTTNLWSPITITANSPGADGGSRMFWTGTYALILGNADSIGRYRPNTNTWDAPGIFPGGASYNKKAAVWTGSELWIYDQAGNQIFKYNPGLNSWTTTSILGIFPDPYFNLQSALWSDAELILYGNVTSTGSASVNTFIRYNPLSNDYISSYDYTFKNNKYVNLDVLFIKAGSIILKWGGYLAGTDEFEGAFYRFTRQGTRIYLSSGNSIPTIYVSSDANKPLYLYQKN